MDVVIGQTTESSLTTIIHPNVTRSTKSDTSLGGHDDHGNHKYYWFIILGVLLIISGLVYIYYRKKKLIARITERNIAIGNYDEYVENQDEALKDLEN